MFMEPRPQKDFEVPEEQNICASLRITLRPYGAKDLSFANERNKYLAALRPSRDLSSEPWVQNVSRRLPALE
jgi:hypothetical protein